MLNDTQLYLSFKPGLRESHVEALLHMQRCIDDLPPMDVNGSPQA